MITSSGAGVKSSSSLELQPPAYTTEKVTLACDFAELAVSMAMKELIVEEKLAESVEEAAEMTMPENVEEAAELFVEVVHGAGDKEGVEAKVVPGRSRA